MKAAVKRMTVLAVLATAVGLSGCAAPRTVPTYLENIYESLRGTEGLSRPIYFGERGPEMLREIQRWQGERDAGTAAALAH